MHETTHVSSDWNCGCTGKQLLAASDDKSLDSAADILAKSIAHGDIAAAVLHVAGQRTAFTRSFGKASSEDAMFLLGSISKPICVTALMTLYDRGEFKLDDPVKKFIPKFTGDGRDQVTVQHLLTHTSGLPDQLPENDALRKGHTQLPEFIEHATSAHASLSRRLAISVFEHGHFAGVAGRAANQRRDNSGAGGSRGIRAAGDAALGAGAWPIQARRHGPLPDRSRRPRNPAAAIQPPKTGIGTVPTGASLARHGEAFMPPRRTWPDSSPSSFTRRARQ